MDAQTLSDLQPEASTGAAIEGALSRLAAAREAVQSRKREAEVQKLAASTDFTLTSAKRRELNDTLEDADQDLAQLAALETALIEQREAALLRERDEQLQQRQQEAAALLAAHVAKWDANYPKLHRQLKALLKDRAVVAQAVAAHNEQAEQHRAASRFKLNAAGLHAALSEVRLVKSEGQHLAEEELKEWTNHAAPRAAYLHELITRDDDEAFERYAEQRKAALKEKAAAIARDAAERAASESRVIAEHPGIMVSVSDDGPGIYVDGKRVNNLY